MKSHEEYWVLKKREHTNFNHFRRVYIVLFWLYLTLICYMENFFPSYKYHTVCLYFQVKICYKITFYSTFEEEMLLDFPRATENYKRKMGYHDSELQ